MIYKKYEFFLEIAKYGSVTKAAEHIIISQSALSKYLKRLEEEVGTSLFDRSTLPLKLTRAGEVFLRHVTQCMAMETLCEQQLQLLQNKSIEALRIGIGTWRATSILPKFLPNFQSKYPFIQTEIIEGIADANAEAVHKGQQDLCILGNAARYPFLESILLKNEPVLLVGNRSHPLVKQMAMKGFSAAGYAHVDLHDFSRESFVIGTKKEGFFRHIHETFEGTTFHPASVIYSDNLHTNMYTVAYSDYFSFLPEAARHTLYLPENLAFFTFGSPTVTYPLSLAYSRNRPLSNAAQLFIQEITECYRREFNSDLLTP